ncbi:MAG: hypothetical protein ABH879_02875 [archaeon]
MRVAFFAMALLILGCTPPEPSAVQDNAEIGSRVAAALVGRHLIYHDFAGQERSFTIEKDHIGEISDASLDGRIALKVTVGDGLLWDIYLDESGTEIIKEVQLFRT